MQQDHRIVGIHLTDRLQRAVELQAVLTEYGACIKTRLGLHEVEHADSPNGVVLLETVGAPGRIDAMVAALKDIDGLEVQEMRFAHETGQ